jgi:hypothetical protein
MDRRLRQHLLARHHARADDERLPDERLAHLRIDAALGQHKGHRGHKGQPYFFLCVLCVLCVHSAVLSSQVQIGVEAQHDRFTYRFENRSAFDTTFLVPHFFEQTYKADNIWLVGRARYAAAGIRWETFGGVAPGRDSTGTDYDTFFNPDGTVIVSGTSGGISIGSWRVGQRAEIARRDSLSVFGGYRLRVDRSDFQLGHETVTRNGALVEATDVTTREMTSSQLHEILTGLTLSLPLGSRWGLTLETEIAPVAIGRLLVQLPDKYPGQDLVFLSKLGTATGRFRVEPRRDGWGFAVVADAGWTWSYSSANVLDRRNAGIGFLITR